MTPSSPVSETPPVEDLPLYWQGWAKAIQLMNSKRVHPDEGEMRQAAAYEKCAEELRASLRARSSADIAELDIWRLISENVKECVAEGDGVWVTCSGCHESEDGHSIGYPHSKVFGCRLGSGCGECGGIGAVWDTTDYEHMAKTLTDEMQSDDVAQPPLISEDDISSLEALAKVEEFGSFHAALIRALDVLKGGGDAAQCAWQPIETAPHETDVILGWWYIPPWKDSAPNWETELGWATRGWAINGISTRSAHGSATHWMPLPQVDPPALALSSTQSDGPTPGFRLIEEPCEHEHCEFPTCGCEVPLSSPEDK